MAEHKNLLLEPLNDALELQKILVKMWTGDIGL
jgi:hypothetical protein